MWQSQEPIRVVRDPFQVGQIICTLQGFPSSFWRSNNDEKVKHANEAAYLRVMDFYSGNDDITKKVKQKTLTREMIRPAIQLREHSI